MRTIVSAGLCVLLSSLALAQGPSAPQLPPQRKVDGQTIVSKELPAAELTFGKDFRYVGGQVVNLYGIADAEQHLFVKAPNSGAIERFYWVQFEHFLPSNAKTYHYKPDRTTERGGLQFIYDVEAFSDYAGLENADPATDGFAIHKPLAEHNLALPKRAARVRMIHLPTADRRNELMIIYGESLPEDSKVPVAADGLALDDASPASAKTVLDHAWEELTIQKR
jgi:hypothetical protein